MVICAKSAKVLQSIYLFVFQLRILNLYNAGNLKRKQHHFGEELLKASCLITKPFFHCERTVNRFEVGFRGKEGV